MALERLKTFVCANIIAKMNILPSQKQAESYIYIYKTQHFNGLFQLKETCCLEQPSEVVR